MTKKFNKISSVLYFVFFVLVGLSVIVQASPIESPVSSKFDDLVKIINSVLEWVRYLAIIALLGYTTYGGYVKLTAGGDAEKDKQSMMIIKSGITGFIIIMIAPIIVSAVGNLLGTKTI